MAAHVPTPNLSHLRSEKYESVYEPSEDSFLFLDALEKEGELLKSRNPLLCVEIGSGSGVVLAFLATILGNSSYYLSVDINVRSSQCTQHTLRVNRIQNIDCLNDNLLTSLMPRLAGAVDILLFNPPYVPTPSDEVGGTGLSASWAGGTDGREVIDLVLPQVRSLLNDTGLFYLVTVKENNPDEICYVMSQYGLSSETVLSRRAHNEYLSVLKFSKSNNNT